MLERMAEEAERWSGLETARLIRTAEDNIFFQNTPLEKAALLLKTSNRRKGTGNGHRSDPGTQSSPALLRGGVSGKVRRKC